MHKKLRRLAFHVCTGAQVTIGLAFLVLLAVGNPWDDGDRLRTLVLCAVFAPLFWSLNWLTGRLAKSA